ncbi:MAG: hypothetical protein COB24_11960 [Hyphomicrobiales bacterium]|nr:MAG: hypothetical protein COB24_11960 [Hyphomicrobiales bacterium]
MYATKQNLINKYDEKTLIRFSSKSANGTMDDDVIAAALDEASAIIDGYISKQYDLPLSNVPVLLVGYCIDISIHNLATGKGAITDDITRRYDNAIKFLKDVARGDLGLGLPKKQAEAASSSKILFTQASPRLFERGTF